MIDWGEGGTIMEWGGGLGISDALFLSTGRCFSALQVRGLFGSLFEDLNGQISYRAEVSVL